VTEDVKQEEPARTRTETPEARGAEDDALELAQKLLTVVFSLSKTQLYEAISRYFIDSIAEAEFQANHAGSIVEKFAGQIRAEMLKQIQDELAGILAGDPA
jgi:hypothetical protein